MTPKTQINEDFNESVGNINDKYFLHFQNSVRKYINSMRKKNKSIHKLSEIYNKIYLEIDDIPSKYHISKATFYRYAKKINLIKYTHPHNGKHYYEIGDFNNNVEETFLEFNLSFKKYNKTLYVTVAPHLGILLAAFLNCNFNSNIFYATYTQDLLICHYRYIKNSEKDNLGKTYLTSEYIKTEIKRIATTIAYRES